jgi:exodeoxyribonuclease III
MPFTIATWNINSVRLRKDLVAKYLALRQPDVLCLQEIKCREEEYPGEHFAALGYTYQAVHGQKGYHGVATLSRHPLTIVEKRKFCEIDDARHVSVDVDLGEKTVRVHNFYVPAGGDEPDVKINPKFAHKLKFVDEMNKVTADAVAHPSILVGDLNIAPLEHDVWSHKQLLNVVSHTPIETTSFEAMRKFGKWQDLMRLHTPEPDKLYTWWSYRAADWALSNRGRRLDHIWATSGMETGLKEIEILREARGWERTSDHVPVLARFE